MSIDLTVAIWDRLYTTGAIKWLKVAGYCPKCKTNGHSTPGKCPQCGNVLFVGDKDIAIHRSRVLHCPATHRRIDLKHRSARWMSRVSYHFGEEENKQLNSKQPLTYSEALAALRSPLFDVIELWPLD